MNGRRIHVFLFSVADKWAVEVSAVITKSRCFIISILSTNALSELSRSKNVTSFFCSKSLLIDFYQSLFVKL